MAVKESITRTLSSLAHDLSPSEIAELAILIDQRIAKSTDLANLSDALLIEKLQPTLQIMLARDHSSITNAAQYAIQVLVTQVIEDPVATIPNVFRDKQYCPYPGLAAFSAAEAELFYGREDDIEAFLLSAQRPITAITGPSGVGKSSLVFGGIVPRLKEQYGQTAAYLTFRVSTSIGFLNDLAYYIAEQIGDPYDNVLGSLHKNDSALLETLQQLCSDQTEHIFLVLDQFEELFIGDDLISKQERQRLLDNLLYVDSHEQQFLSIVIASRENYFEHPDYTERPRLVEIVQRENIPLDALTDQQLRDAIERPLEIFNHKHAQNLEFQTGLVNLIVQGFRRPAISLPLVQYLLRLLWTEKYHLTHLAYNSLGGLERVLDRHAQDIYKSFSEEDQPKVKAVLIALVRPGLGDEYTRKRVRKDSFLFQSDAKQRTHLQKILQRLSDSRSRIISEQQYGEIAYVELTHEVLLRQWAFLQDLIQVRKEHIEERERLVPTAELWLQSVSTGNPKGNSSYLFRSDNLRRAQRYVEDARLSGDIDGSIAACYEASQNYHRWNFIRNTVILVISMLVFGAIIFALLSSINIARDQANTNATAEALAKQQANTNATAKTIADATAIADRALSDKLAILRKVQSVAEQAKIDMEQFPQRSLLLAIEAVRLSQVKNDSILPAAEEAFRQILASVSGRGLSGHTVPITAIKFSPDSRWLITTGRQGNGIFDGTIRLWDMEASNPAATPVILNGHKQGVEAIEVSLDGRWMISIGDGDLTAYAWQLTGSNPAQNNIDLRGENAPIAISPNSEWLATSDDHEVHLWKLSSLSKQSKPILLKGHNDRILSLAFSRDGKWLVTGSEDQTARLWRLDIPDPASASILLKGHFGIIDILLVTSDSHWLVTAGGKGGIRTDDHTVRLWDLSSSDPSTTSVVLRGHNGQINGAALSPDNHWLVTTSSDDTEAHLWNMSAQNPADNPTLIKGGTQGPYFSPNGRWLLIAAQLYDLAQDNPLEHPTKVASGNVANGFSPDSNWLVANSTAYHLASQEDTQGQVILASFSLRGNDASFSSIAFSPNSRWLVAGNVDTTARIWDLNARVPGSALSPQTIRIKRPNDEVTVVAVTDRWLAAGGGGLWVDKPRTGSVQLVDRKSNSIDISPRILNGHKEPITSMALSSDNHWLVTANGRQPFSSTNEYTAILWNLNLTETISQAMFLEGAFAPVAISPNSHWLVTGSNASAKIYDLTKLPIPNKSIEFPENNVDIIKFSDDSKWLLIASYNNVTIYDLSDPQFHLVNTLKGHTDSILTMDISKDKHWLVTGSSDHTVRLWDLTVAEASEKSTILTERDDAATSVTISDNSRWIAAASWGAPTMLWDMQRRDWISQPIYLRGHDATVYTLLISSDNRWLTTASDNSQQSGSDGSVRLWDLSAEDISASSRTISPNSSNAITWTSLASDGQTLITGGADNTVRMWALDIDQLIGPACQVVGRTLTQAEWSRYFGDLPYQQTCQRHIKSVKDTSILGATPSSSPLSTTAQAIVDTPFVSKLGTPTILMTSIESSTPTPTSFSQTDVPIIPSPTPDSDEEYVNAVAAETSFLFSELTILKKQLTEAIYRPNSNHNEERDKKLRSQVDRAERYVSSATRITTVERYAEVHKKYLSAINDLREALQQIKENLSNQGVDIIDDRRFDQGINLLIEVRSELGID